MNIMQKVRELFHDTRGATAVEYGLICSLIIIAIMLSMQGMASETNRMWTRVNSTMATATA